MSGASTPKYRVVRGNFYPLVLNFEQDVATVAAKLFEKEIITSTTFEKASNSDQPAFERSSFLLRMVLKKIKISQRWYDEFYSVLCGIDFLADVTKDLQGALKSVEESSGSPGLRSHQKQQGKVHASRNRSKSRSLDSFLDAKDELLPEEEVDDASVFDCEQQKLELATESKQAARASGTIAKESVQTRSELQVSPSPSALVYAHSSNISGSQNESQDYTLPIERTSSDGASQLIPTLDTFPNSNAWNHETENKYFKSEICDLTERIDNLNEEKASSAAKLKQQGIVVSQKDDEINILKKECKEKDKHVEGLKKDKAEMEKRIKDLEDRCSEADLKQAQSEEEIKSIHDTYRVRLDKLQKELEEVESREKNAQVELANTKTKLSDAKLEKEREISKLREEFFRQEKIKHELELKKLSLEDEKKMATILREKELASEKEERKMAATLKEKELALKDKELVLKDKELAMKEKELAQEKEKHAHEKANRADQEKKSAQEEARQANAKRRDSELRMREMEMELEKLRMTHNTSSQ